MFELKFWIPKIEIQEQEHSYAVEKQQENTRLKELFYVLRKSWFNVFSVSPEK